MGSIVRERAERLNETIERYLNKFQELKDEALRLNLTDLVNEIEEEMMGLEALKGKLASGNLSLSELAGAAASAKGLIKHVEKLIEKASEKMGKHGPEKIPPRRELQRGEKERGAPVTPPGQLKTKP